MAVIYEVTLSVDRAIEGEYRAWLDEHIAQMCALPDFLSATLYEVTAPTPLPGQFSVCVHYRLCDQAALDTYLAQHAARMRADGEARFGGRFHAQRRMLAARGAQ